MVLSGCGDDDGLRGRSLAELVDAGWSVTEATCFVDAALESVGPTAFDAEAELSPEQLDAIYAVSKSCRVGGDEDLALNDPIGYGEITEQDLNDAPSELSEAELLEWADKWDLDAGPAGADPATLRREAIEDLTVSRGFTVGEAECIADSMMNAVGPRGLDFKSVPAADVVDAERAAIAACT